MTEEITIVDVSEILPLRGKVLRTGRPPHTWRFEQDELPGVIHFAAMDEGKVNGIATVYPSMLQGENGRGFQLRGMAVDPEVQGKGLGAHMLQYILQTLHDQAAYLWCNARSSASGFYLKNGFETISDEFEIPHIGPHFRMIRRW